MLANLIKEINKIILEKFKIPVVSTDITDNITPCFKTDIIDYAVIKKTNNIYVYYATISVNYYPKLPKNKIDFINVETKLGELFSFDIGRYKVTDISIVDRNDFITCTVDYESTIITSDKTRGMEDVEYEEIENIEVLK